MAIYEYKTEIRYNEISEKNELSDKGLLNILSEAASVHSNDVGRGLNKIDKTNSTWMILYWKVKIFKRPRWKTSLSVKTWARKYNKVLCWRDFDVSDDKGEKVAIATTQWVPIDLIKKSICRVTEEIMEPYGVVENSVFEEETINTKMVEPEGMEKIYEYITKRRDLDTNHHVNNIAYLEFAYDALPNDISVDFNNIEIYYKKQTKLGEKIACFYKKEEDSHIVAIKSEDGEKLHAIIRFSK